MCPNEYLIDKISPQAGLACQGVGTVMDALGWLYPCRTADKREWNGNKRLVAEQLGSCPGRDHEPTGKNERREEKHTRKTAWTVP